MPDRTLGSEELAELGVYLRSRDFSVGAAQVLAAQRLLWRMAQEGISKPAADLAPWLGPVFATSDRDLDRFTGLYEEWQTELPAQPPPPSPPPDRKIRWLLVWSAVAGLIIALAAGGWWMQHRPVKVPKDGDSKRSTIGKNQDGKKSPNVILPPPTPTTVTATGVLRGSDGKPVAHARLLFAGANSLESDSNGAFTVTGTSSEPVLAVHCDYDAVLFPLVNRNDYILNMVRKANSACTPGVGPAVPEGRRPGYRRIRLGVSAMPLAAFILWTAWVVWKRIGLRKWRGAASSKFAQLPLGDSADSLFSETELQRSVQELRRPRPIPLEEIWVEPTVTSTVENAGWFSPVYRARRQTTGYLVLIDRRGKRDQQARFAGELLDRLKARGVYAHVHYFHSDPRTCTEPETGRSVALTDLSARFGNCQVWVVADSASFFSVFTGRPEPWVDILQQWPARVLLTNATHSEWGDREIRLADLGFEVVPATARGLARIADHLAAPQVALDSYPPWIEEHPTRSTSNQPPSSRDIARLSTELRLYLGRDGFRWLAACAEYPVIEWPLNLYLGRALMPSGSLEPVLRKLVRLPWFRQGSMPRWLRESLVRKGRALRKQVRRLLADRIKSLASKSEPGGTGSAVEVAIERDYRRRVEEDDVWLSLLWGREPDGVALPSSGIRRLLFHRGRVWLGPRPVVLLIASVLMSAGIWSAMGYGVPQYRPPEPQIERIALDIARSQFQDPSYYLADARNAAFPIWCYNVTQLVLGRHISLGPSAFGNQAIPGTVSYGGDGIVADTKWSLVLQRNRIVASPNQAPYQAGILSGGPLPSLPPLPPEVPPTPAGCGAGATKVTPRPRSEPSKVATKEPIQLMKASEIPPPGSRFVESSPCGLVDVYFGTLAGDVDALRAALELLAVSPDTGGLANADYIYNQLSALFGGAQLPNFRSPSGNTVKSVVFVSGSTQGGYGAFHFQGTQADFDRIVVDSLNASGKYSPDSGLGDVKERANAPGTGRRYLSTGLFAADLVSSFETLTGKGNPGQTDGAAPHRVLAFKLAPEMALVSGFNSEVTQQWWRNGHADFVNDNSQTEMSTNGNGAGMMFLLFLNDYLGIPMDQILGATPATKGAPLGRTYEALVRVQPELAKLAGSNGKSAFDAMVSLLQKNAQKADGSLNLPADGNPLPAIQGAKRGGLFTAIRAGR
jgi:hypothetical protein